MALFKAATYIMDKMFGICSHVSPEESLLNRPIFLQPDDLILCAAPDKVVVYIFVVKPAGD